MKQWPDRDWQLWRDAVLNQVRFWPDHKAIQKELDAHYEDHKKDLERLGYEPALAAERTLKAMGDPREVGRALNKAHKPWLGWLWQFTRGLLAVLLVTAAICTPGILRSASA